MSLRVYYIRDQINIRTKQNGLPTKGNPVVCIVSDFNSETKELKYGYAAVHPQEGILMKSRARDIAIGRLNKKGITLIDVAAKNNHELNKVVIENLAAMSDQFSKPKRFIELANQWLVQSQESDLKRLKQKEEKPSLSIVSS